ncbi:Maf family protein [Ignatzschineria larvae DSM 13226]|uniref:dTTP/UTP pyrophosphatase n=1 Tax=Ignatzschineria larvae DSM 13226 TaxID=1111732 RepID=A0ABZ3C1V6_9GAMM|nr:Maf family protein [Ignatzschineria larvae]
MQNLKILLASRSPRRRELLTQLGLNYQVIDVEVDESIVQPILPEVYAKEISEKKALMALANGEICVSERDILLTADTTLSVDGDIIGKPKDLQDYLHMMKKLSNRTHQVFTALTLVGMIDGEEKFVTMLSETTVQFSLLPEQFVLEYWQSGEPADKAGGYAIQGKMAGYIQSIKGSYSGVMGLPLFELREALEAFDHYI